MTIATLVSGPYGLRPINLIGGQVFSGSTRNLPIQYAYATQISYGDFVTLNRGFVERASITNAASGNLTIGVFLGCTYTVPATRQRVFSQFWPASTLAGDAMAVVCDDPDTVFKAVVVSAQGGTGLGSGNLAIVGKNVVASNLAGLATTGNSRNGIVAPTTTPVTTSLPIRVIDVVRDTAQSTSAPGSSSGTAITLTTGVSIALPSGTDVAYLASDGQVIQTGSYVNGAVAAGATSVTLDSAIAVPGGITAIPAASTIIFTTYPEVLVKIQFGNHGYYTATGT